MMKSLSNLLNGKKIDTIIYGLDKSRAISIMDAEERFIYANQLFCMDSKYSQDELIGKTHHILSSGFHPKEFFKNILDTITSGIVWSGEIKNRAKDGSYYWEHISVIPVYNEGSKPDAFISIGYNITDRKQDEARQLQQERLISLGMMAGSLAHEIGTPLGIIRSLAEITQRKYSQQTELKNDLVLIVSQVDRISKYMNSLLFLARPKTNEPLANAPLNKIIDHDLNLIKHELDRRDIKIENQINDDISVFAEGSMLGQIILNLLMNSIDAIDTAEARDHTHDHKITIKTQIDDKYIYLYVKDTGCGIEDNVYDQLFKPFFTTKDIGSGLGLSLASSFKILQSWGGHIEAVKEKGPGATFLVKLARSSNLAPQKHIYQMSN